MLLRGIAAGMAARILGDIIEFISTVDTSQTGAVCRQSISDSWLGNLRECLAHLV
jgi:hypothetical protein